MAIDGLHHLVLKVPDLPEAEAFYRDLFDLDVLFREGTKGETFGKVPDHLDWPEAVERDVEPGMSFLGRDAFALALVEGDAYGEGDVNGNRDGDAGDGNGNADASRLDHVALALDPEDRDAVRDRADELDCEYEEKGDAVFVTDHYGVEWELNASSPPPETPFDALDV